MTDDEREAIQSGIAAMEKCGWTHRVPVLRAILARQPAAIDKQEAAVTREEVEQDERGAFEAWWIRDVPAEYQATARMLLKQEMSGGYASVRCQSAWEAWQARAASTSANVAQYRNEALSALLVDHSHAASAKDVDAVLKARDAIYSMFANVAQGADDDARAAVEFYAANPSAALLDFKKRFNVAQGAEAVAWFIPDDNGEVYRTTGYEHERDQWRALGHAVFPLYTAPPAQTAITEQMLEKLYWTAMDNSADILKYMEEAIALTAAQSASGDTKP